MDLPKEDRALLRDLILLNHPPEDWRQGNPQRPNPDPTYDVVIIGAGMAGLTAGAALFKEGIFHIKLFDQSPQGLEGPWKTYARMRTLRSVKDIMGPALGIPHLTFHAWFEALFGAEAWKQLGKIPNDLWMDYLKWYRHAMQLPIENHCTLVSLIPMQECFELEFQQLGQPLLVKARKVVLATGRAGFGGPVIPNFVKHLPKSVYAHTTENIDFEALKNRRIGIIGVGASSFDAAAVALETGVKSVDLIMRRNHLPNVNKFSSLPYKGFNYGYCQLSDEKRWQFMLAAFDAAIPPPMEALKRVEGNSNLRILSNTSISQISYEDSQISIETNRGLYSYDFLILGTGFHIDGYQQPELQHVIDHIALWKDRLPYEIIKTHPKMGDFPYLGPSFEFLPKKPGTAPYLKNLYCYNYGATLSHGLLSSDIPAISIGATRLAQGIAADFFVQESDWFLQCLKEYQEKDFEQEDYLFIIE
ncbi:MAG: NAD(P)/FAD-dependent oxidoreductase [Proteobacteria bacterium]|nr:NAD(P)/FAD-dependent oxidoreductase [Pseudomonadota bacterium]